MAARRAAAASRGLRRGGWGEIDAAGRRAGQLRRGPPRVAAQKATMAPIVASPKPRCDVVLSSGFLAFAYHCGFVEAVVSEMEVAGIMGTSAGALTGSLLAAGLTPDEICYELSRVAPMEYLSPNPALWQGVLKMDGVVRRLTQLLPPTFDELQTPFACAVVDVRTGGYRVISEGRLPEAVTASAAVPVLFKPVCVPGVPGGPFEDGGKHDRVGLKGLEELRRAGGLGDPRGVDTGPMVHLIERSTPFSGDDDVTEAAKRYDATVVRSPKAGQNLWALNQDTFAAQRAVASERTRMVLDERRAALKSSRRLVA